MKKLFVISLLLLALVVTVVACQNDTPLVDMTVAETTGAEEPTAAPTDPANTTAEDPIELPTEPETTAAPEETTAAPEETTKKAEETPTEPQQTEPEPVDPMAPVNMFDAEKLNSNTASGNGIESIELIDNFLRITPNTSDPNYYPFANVDGARYVAIKYRSDNATGTAVQFYLASTGSAPSDDTSMLRMSTIADGKWHIALFDTQSLIDANIYDGSHVSYFRFDALECDYILDAEGNPQKDPVLGWLRSPMPEGAYIDIQYVAFFNSPEAVARYESAPLFVADAATLAAAQSNLASASGNDNFVTFTGTGEDGWVLAANAQSIPGSFISVVYRTSVDTEIARGEFFAGSGAGATGGSSTKFNYTNDGKWQMTLVDASAHPDFTGNLAYIRYDFYTVASDISIDVRYVAVFDSAEAAEAYYALHLLDAAVEPYEAGVHTQVCKDSQGADNNSAYVVGWTGFDQPMVAAGYSIDNAAIEWNGTLNDVGADDPVCDPANGGELAKRYSISAPLTDLFYGAHNIKFYIELADGTIVIIHEIDCETADPSAVGDTVIDFDSNENGDLQAVFTFSAGLAPENCNYTAAPYKMSGINQLTARMDGTYVWTVTNYASGAKAWGTLFVRGLPNPSFGDGNYFGHDSSGDVSIGCAGIYINIFEGNLYINVKGMGDGNVPVPNIVTIPYEGTDLTIADDGDKVIIYNGDTLLAAVYLEGDKAGMAESATVMLPDGTATTFTDLAVASSVMGADIGFIARGCDVTFDATTVKPIATATVPAVPALPVDPMTVEKTEFVVGEPIMITAIGEGQDWVGIGLRGNYAESIAYYYVADVSGTAVNLFELGDKGTGEILTTLPAGEYTLYLVPNNMGLQGAHEANAIISEINITIVEAPPANYKVDLTTVAGHEVDWAAAGISGAFCKLGYGSFIAIGDVDLSKYSSVKISYCCDGSEITKGNFESASSLAIGLKSEGSSYGQVTDDNFSGDIAHTDMVFSDKGWGSGIRDAVVDLTGIDYNGPVFVTVHNPAGTEIAITGIEFVI